MAQINLGEGEYETNDLLIEQRFLASIVEAQIAGLQEYLATRHELIEWLKDVDKEDQRCRCLQEPR